jgi:hypothetical protein
MPLTQVDQGLLGQYAQYTGFKNRIINGAMVIDQRNNGASVTYPGSGSVGSELYVIDRWAGNSTGSTRFSMQRSTTAPAGFTNSLLITTTTAGTPGASDFCYFVQGIEGFNTADLGFGTANAQTVTISFWIRSSLTGSFGGSISNSAANRRYPFSFAISAANTWEYKTITIPGDTTGTWLTDNGRGITLVFNLGTGSTNEGPANAWATTGIAPTGSVDLVATAGATLNITGVQLEKGSTATSFDYRPYGTELALCQRYYYRRNYDQSTVDVVAVFAAYSSGGAWGKIIDLPVEMRATPTGSLSSIGHFRPTNSTGSAQAAFSAGSLAGQGTSKSQLTTAGWSGSSGLSAGNATAVVNNTTSAWIDASAEL